MSIKNNPDKMKKTICFDIDGVICANTWGNYSQAKPHSNAIKKNK